MKDDQLSRFIELAMFDLGEMKPFADFLEKKKKLQTLINEQVDPRQIPHSRASPLQKS